MALSKITLGTAQLGLDYGISNETGKLDQATSNAILDTAIECGINTIDTAILYGDSEEKIGKWLQKSGITVNVITKIPYVKDLKGNALVNEIVKLTKQSMNRLNSNKIYGLMFHSCEFIRSNFNEVKAAIRILSKSNLVENFGVSLYQLEELLYVMANFDLDIFQVPINLCNFKIISNPKVIEYFKKPEKKLFARSIFLQGLFFLSEDMAEKKVSGSKKILSKLNLISKKYGLSIQEMALLFVSNHSIVDSLVLGIADADQIIDNVNALKKISGINKLSDIMMEIEQGFVNVDESIYNPVLWRSNDVK